MQTKSDHFGQFICVTSLDTPSAPCFSTKPMLLRCTMEKKNYPNNDPARNIRPKMNKYVYIHTQFRGATLILPLYRITGLYFIITGHTRYSRYRNSLHNECEKDGRYPQICCEA